MRILQNKHGVQDVCFWKSVKDSIESIITQDNSVVNLGRAIACRFCIAPDRQFEPLGTPGKIRIFPGCPLGNDKPG